MKKILLTTFAILILPISFSYAEESATAGDLASATTGDKKALGDCCDPGSGFDEWDSCR